MQSEQEGLVGVRLCPSLTSKHKCIRVQEYNQGQFIERFHEHVLAYKLAQSCHWALLRTLVLRYEEATGEQIVDVYLTRRGRDAKRYHHGAIVVENPAPVVVRDCCGGNVGASIDTVVLPEDFRASAENDLVAWIIPKDV